jgi:hypothetical protein
MPNCDLTAFIVRVVRVWKDKRQRASLPSMIDSVVQEDKHQRVPSDDRCRREPKRGFFALRLKGVFS